MPIDPFCVGSIFFALFLSFATVKLATSPIFFALDWCVQRKFPLLVPLHTK